MTAVSPSAGPLGGSTSVTITGTNLTGATAVEFRGHGGAVHARTPRPSITVNAPGGSPGTVDVTVTTPGGTSATSSADHFTYMAAPTVTGRQPECRTPGGTTGVTVTGTNLSGAKPPSISGAPPARSRRDTGT